MSIWFKVALLALMLVGFVFFAGGILGLLYCLWKTVTALLAAEWLASAAWLFVGGAVSGLVHSLGVVIMSLALAIGGER